MLKFIALALLCFSALGLWLAAPPNRVPELEVPVLQEPAKGSTVDHSVQVNSRTAESKRQPLAVNENGMIPTDQAIEMMQSRISKRPTDYASRTILGQLLMRKAKEDDDHRSYVAAENAFREAIEVNPEASKAASIHLIEALHAQHKFQPALDQSEKALAKVPGNLVALAGQGDALMELGKLEEAKACFDRVAKEVKTPGVLARLARIAELNGDSQSAIKLITEARDKSIQYNEKSSTTAWYDYRLGLLHLGLGHLERAEKEFQTGIDRGQDECRSIDGLAEVRMAQGELEVAEKLFRKSLAINEAPPTVARLGDLLLKLNRPEQAKAQFDLAERLMAEEAEFTGVAHYRERARFLLDHDRQLELALSLAQKDYELRQDIYSADLLAWALHKNGQSELAMDYAKQAVATGMQDAELYFHAGQIAAALDLQEQADAYLEQVRTINPTFEMEQDLSPVSLNK